jgi:hypothetical protein
MNTETLTANELLILQRIAERQRIEHGKLVINMSIKAGTIQEVHVCPEHRIIPKKIDLLSQAMQDNNN